MKSANLLLVLVFALALYLPVFECAPLYNVLLQEGCSASQFSACGVQTVFDLVSQAKNALSSPVGQSNPSAVLASITTGGPQYNIGPFNLQVYDSNFVKVADSSSSNTTGQTFDQILANWETLTSPNLDELLETTGGTGGAWAYAYSYNWTGTSNSPVSQQFWVSQATTPDNQYTLVSGFSNREFNQLGGYCNSNYFSECSSMIVYDLVEEGKKELGLASTPQDFFTVINNSTKYNLNGGFVLTVLGSDGTVLAGDYTFNSSSVPWSDFVFAAASNGSWVVYNTGLQERQAWVVSVQAQDGNTYWLFSSHGTATTSYCPPCNCPACLLTPCPVCSYEEVAECAPEVTKLKFDFGGLV